MRAVLYAAQPIGRANPRNRKSSTEPGSEESPADGELADVNRCQMALTASLGQINTNPLATQGSSRKMQTLVPNRSASAHCVGASVNGIATNCLRRSGALGPLSRRMDEAPSCAVIF